MDLNEHISKYLVGNDSRHFKGDTVRRLEELIDFFRDVPFSFAEQQHGDECPSYEQELANDFLDALGYGGILFTATDYVPDYNLFLGDNMTEEQADTLSASRTARLVIELGPDEEQPRLDLLLKPETDEFHTVWGAHDADDGTHFGYDASWLGLFYDVGGEGRYLEIHFCPWLP